MACFNTINGNECVDHDYSPVTTHVVTQVTITNGVMDPSSVPTNSDVVVFTDTGFGDPQSKIWNMPAFTKPKVVIINTSRYNINCRKTGITSYGSIGSNTGSFILEARQGKAIFYTSNYGRVVGGSGMAVVETPGTIYG